MSSSCIVCRNYRPPEGIIMFLDNQWFEVCMDCLDVPGQMNSDELGLSLSARECWNYLADQRGKPHLDVEQYPVNPNPP